MLSERGVDNRHPKIGIWANIPMDRDQLHQGIEQLIGLAKQGERGVILNQIGQLVPEYVGGDESESS